MNWFQRYGIPGISFWGLFSLWIMALYKCNFDFTDAMSFNGGIGVLFGIAAVFFLPVGFIITIVAQTIYLYVRIFGVHRRAAKKAEVDFGKGGREWLLGARAYIYTLHANKVNNKEALTKVQHMQRGLMKRFDVMTIDFSLFLATCFASLIATIVLPCLGWSRQISPRLLIAVSSLSLIILLITFFNWLLLRLQTIKMIEGLYRFMAGQPLSDDDQSAHFIRKKGGSQSGEPCT